MSPQLRELADETYAVHFEDQLATVEQAAEVYEHRPFDCIVAFTELAMVPAAMIAERLGVPGASTVATAQLLRDKAEMREKLNSAGLSPVVSGLIRSIDDAQKLADAVGYPLILKPRYGTGSMAVQRIDSAADLPTIVQAALSADLPPAVQAALSADPRGFILEKFIAGTEFSVEAFTFHGTHQMIAIAEKQITANYVEMGHVVPADVPVGERDAIFDLVGKFLDLVGVTEGPSHTEVIVNDGQPWIVESHDRLGGDKIFRLIEIAYGIDLLSWCYQWPLGLMTPPSGARPEARAAACIRYLQPEPGRVTRISVPEEVHADKSLDHMELEVTSGDEVRPLSCSLDRAGFVVASAEDRGGAIEAAERLASRIVIETLKES